MNLYNITKGQLIVLWIILPFIGMAIGTVIGEVLGGGVAVVEGSLFLPFLLSFGVLIFYTLGWRNYNKKP